MRKRLGLRQTELAQILGVHFVTVSRWETGRYAVPPYHQAMLAAFDRGSYHEGIGDRVVSQVLVGSGPIAALYFILQAAFEPERRLRRPIAG